jgi:DnaJ-class molecular chaperone
MMRVEDPYVVLGVARDASPDDVRRAYRKLAKQHHPDLNPGNKVAEDRFKQVAAAHDLLSDPEQRARFDRGEIDAEGQQRPPPGARSYRDQAEGAAGRRYAREGGTPWGEDNLDDLFGDMFRGGTRQGAGASRPTRGRDEQYTLPTAFLDAIRGATRRLTLPDGRTLDVKIPPGTEQGDVLRLRGQGAPGRQGAPAGDALIEIHLLPHPFYVRDGQDLRMTLPVTLPEAVLGGPVTVPTPAGPVTMTIPAGSDTGRELRLRGRGVPAHRGLEAGNLYVTLSVVLGPPDPALEAFLRDWKPVGRPDPRRSMQEDA